MRKVFLIGIVVAAFFAGTLLTAFSIADATNGDNAWAKLIARVVALEGQLDGNSIKYVHLEDDDAGHAVGWDPDDSQGVSFFTIIDPDATLDSVISVTTNGGVCAAMNTIDGEFLIICDGTVASNAFVNYSVLNP